MQFSVFFLIVIVFLALASAKGNQELYISRWSWWWIQMLEDKNKISRSRTLTPSFLSVCFFVLYCVSHFLKNIGRGILMLVVYLVARPIVSPHLGILLAVFENKITKKSIRLLVSCTSLCRIMETSRLCLFCAYQVYCWCSSIFYSDNYSKPVTICIWGSINIFILEFGICSNSIWFSKLPWHFN